MKKHNCAICGKLHEPMESNLCDTCIKKYSEYLVKIMPKKDADSLLWIIGNVDLGVRWNTEEIVKQQDKLDELSINFKKHDHKNGNLVKYL